MKRHLLLFAIPLLFACNSTSTKTSDTDTVHVGDTSGTFKKTNAELLIVPGQSIGAIKVGQDVDSVINLLGKPDNSDAAMGSAMYTWFDKHDTTASAITVFSRRDMGGPDEAVSRIRKIMVASPTFKTAEGLGAGSNAGELKDHFSLAGTGSYRSKEKNILIYDDTKKGIGFEVDSLSKKCIAVIVHAPGDSTAAYINMH